MQKLTTVRATAHSAVHEPAHREKITTIVLVLVLDICFHFHVAETSTELIMGFGVFWHDILNILAEIAEGVAK